MMQYVITNEDEFEVTSKEKPPHFPSKVSAYAKTSKVPYSPAKFTAPFRPNKGNNLTPVATANKPAMDISYTKRSTPKSSRKSINFTPAQELSRLTSTIIQKIDGPRMASYSKASKECSTPSRTPNTVQFSSETSLLCYSNLAVLFMDANFGFHLCTAGFYKWKTKTNLSHPLVRK